MEYIGEPEGDFPDIEFSRKFTTEFCERCKPHGKCLGLRTLADKAWKESVYFHTDAVNKIIEELQEAGELIS